MESEEKGQNELPRGLETRESLSKFGNPWADFVSLKGKPWVPEHVDLLPKAPEMTNFSCFDSIFIDAPSQDHLMDIHTSQLGSISMSTFA